MDAREAEDVVNDFGRSAVGERKEETVRPPCGERSFRLKAS